MKIINVIAKGDRKYIMAECIRRKINATFVRQHQEFHECIVHAPIEELDKVMRWFNDGGMRAPFPYGTCLHYAEIDAPKRPTSIDDGMGGEYRPGVIIALD